MRGGLGTGPAPMPTYCEAYVSLFSKVDPRALAEAWELGQGMGEDPLSYLETMRNLVLDEAEGAAVTMLETVSMCEGMQAVRRAESMAWYRLGGMGCGQAEKMRVYRLMAWGDARCDRIKEVLKDALYHPDDDG